MCREGLCKISSSLWRVFMNMGKMFWFLVCTIAAGIRGPFFYKEFKHQWMIMGILSLPLVALTALFTGMVLALQSYTSFSRFAASGALPEMVSLAFARELGPVLCGLMMSGYWASAISAELATMRVTDQIDALMTLSTNPLRYLVIPRWLAAIIAMPFLTFMADIIGVFGGYIIGVFRYNMDSSLYLAKTIAVLSFTDIGVGLVKGVLFGFIIAFIGCYEGYYAAGGAYGVGVATTRGVVRSSVLILFFNYILTSFLFS